MRHLIFIVAYNAEQHLEGTLTRIPRAWLSEIDYEILILDDASTDQTERVAQRYIKNHEDLKITYQRNLVNKGYGGNQKKGYHYAIVKAYDVVVLLHGDGQYAPEYLADIVRPIINGDTEVVLGSRMIKKLDALKGRMPLYKWLGNQVLTALQNVMLGTALSEFHTGYRAFSVLALDRIPFEHNSDYFDFDTEIIIQLVDTEARFKEISIPTFYGDEVSYVNGLKYAWLIMRATLKSRLVERGWSEDPRFTYTD